MFRSGLSIAVVAGASLAWVSSETAAAVTIVNPSFEQPGEEVGNGFDGTPDVPGWSQTGSVADSGVEGGGQSGAWRGYLNSYDPIVFQTLSHTIAEGDAFTLSFHLISGYDAPQATVSLYKLGAGATRTPLATGNYTGLTGEWSARTITYTATAADAGLPIGIEFDNPRTDTGESWLGVDNFALDVAVVPEPTAVALLGLSLPMLVRRRRGA